MLRRDAESADRKSAKALSAVHPTRRITCPHCGTRFEGAKRAMSLRCPAPHCGGWIQLQDAVLNGATAGSVATLGHVHITKKGAMRGKVECGELRVQGTLAGHAQVRGRALIDAKALVFGKLAAKSIIIEAGARIEADLAIGEPPPPNAKRGERTPVIHVVRPPAVRSAGAA